MDADCTCVGPSVTRYFIHVTVYLFCNYLHTKEGLPVTVLIFKADAAACETRGKRWARARTCHKQHFPK